MGLIDSSHIKKAMEANLASRFGDDAIIRTHNGQMLVLVDPGSKHKELMRFGQVMEYLTFKGTWFQRTHYAAEAVYENSLGAQRLPLPVNQRQVVNHLHKPPSGYTPLESYIQGQTTKDQYDWFLRVDRGWDVVNKALDRHKKMSYSRRKNLHEKQSRMPDFSFTENDRAQLMLEAFQEMATPSTAKHRTNKYRTVRLDMVYEIDDPRAHVIAEIKPFHTLAPSMLEERTWQLRAYDAWLQTVGDIDVTPLAYVMPTMPSHRELDMIREFNEGSERSLVSVTVTTRDFLAKDLSRRRARIENFQKAAEAGRMKVDPSPETLDAHRQEARHVEKALEAIIS